MRNRKGIIRIAHQFISDIDSQPEQMFKLFSEFVPVRIDNDFHTYTYFGYSGFFDEISEGEIVPDYEVIFTYLEETDSFDMQIKRKA